MVTWLEDVGPYLDDELPGAAHPNRPALDSVIATPEDADGWDLLRADYRDQAAAWAEWAEAKENYDAPLRAAFGHVRATGVVLEVGAGSDRSSLPLLGLGSLVVTSDVAVEMISRNPAPVRIACDVRRLPFPDRSIGLVCGLNAVPHFAEFDRILAPHGELLWASSFGSRTPMYVSPEDLERRMPGWSATAQRVAAGEWCLLQRKD